MVEVKVVESEIKIGEVDGNIFYMIENAGSIYPCGILIREID